MAIGNNLISAVRIAVDFSRRTIAGTATWCCFPLSAVTQNAIADDDAEQMRCPTMRSSQRACCLHTCATICEAATCSLLCSATTCTTVTSGACDFEVSVTAEFKPTHFKPYSVPRSQVQAARDEIQRLVILGVLEQQAIWLADLIACVFPTQGCWSFSMAQIIGDIILLSFT